MEEFKRVRKWWPDSDSYARRNGRLKKKMKPRTDKRAVGVEKSSKQLEIFLDYDTETGNPFGWGRNLGGRCCLQKTWFMTGPYLQQERMPRATIPTLERLSGQENSLGGKSLLRTTALIFPVWSSFLGWEFWNSGEEGLKNLEASRGQLLPLTFRGRASPQISYWKYCWVPLSRASISSKVFQM